MTVTAGQPRDMTGIGYSVGIWCRWWARQPPTARLPASSLHPRAPRSEALTLVVGAPRAKGRGRGGAPASRQGSRTQNGSPGHLPSDMAAAPTLTTTHAALTAGPPAPGPCGQDAPVTPSDLPTRPLPSKESPGWPWSRGDQPPLLCHRPFDARPQAYERLPRTGCPSLLHRRCEEPTRGKQTSKRAKDANSRFTGGKRVCRKMLHVTSHWGKR